jgi:hypothetical protein
MLISLGAIGWRQWQERQDDWILVLKEGEVELFRADAN